MSKEKWLKVAKGALISAAGAVLAYLSGSVIPDLEVSGASAAVVAVLGAAVNVAKVILQKVDGNEPA